MSESAIVLSSLDGIGIIVKKIDSTEKIFPFEYEKDPLMTENLKSKFKISTNIQKCEVKSIGSSCAIIVFGIFDERKKVFEIVTKIIKNNFKFFTPKIDLKILADYIESEINKLTHTSDFEFNGEIALATWNLQSGSEIYFIDSSCQNFRYKSCAVGEAKNPINLKLARLHFESLTVNESLTEGLKILMDESEDQFEFEVTRICSETEGNFQDESKNFCDEILKKVIRDSF